MVGRLAALVKGNADGLETELARLQEQAEGDAITNRQLLAVRFYLKAVVEECANTWIRFAHGQTNYATLLNLLDESRRIVDQDQILWVSFNYDPLIEIAARTVLHHEIDSLEQYLAHPNHLFVKPHGSTNWVRHVGFADPTPRNLDFEAVARSKEMAEVGPIAHARAAEHPLIPAIAIPVADKSAFECPQDQIDKLEELLPRVDRVLSVGWRGQESYFLDLCRDRLGDGKRVRMTVVDQDRAHADDVSTHLAGELGSVEVVSSGARGFSAFLAIPNASQVAYEQLAG